MDETRRQQAVHERLVRKLSEKKVATEAGGLHAPPPNPGRMELEDLHRLFNACNGDVTKLVNALGMPREIADLAVEYDRADPDKRDIAQSIHKAESLLSKKK